MLKVKFIEPFNLDRENLNRCSSFRKLSDNQSKRNYLRAKSFRENQPKSKRNPTSELSEIPRNEEHSTTAPNFDHLDCCDSLCGENSTSRVEDSMVTVGSVNADNSSPSKPDGGLTSADAAKCKEKSPQLNQPTPFDSDAESDYDDDAPHMKNWQEYRGQCQDLNCQYNPDVEIGHPDLNQRWGLRPNGTFKVYYACAL